MNGLLNFSAMEAGGPYKLKITGTSNSTPVILEDILIGEVWLCIGQSNMEMPVDSTDSNFCVLNSEQVIQEAQNQQIRFYNSMINHTLAPDGPLLEPCGTGWQCCNEQTVKAMSACGYFFGRQLQKDLSIPIGLIAAAWGGTGITAWISQKKFEEKNYFPPVDTTDDILQKWHSWYDSTASESIKKWLQKFDSQGGMAHNILIFTWMILNGMIFHKIQFFRFLDGMSVAFRLIWKERLL